MLNIVHELEQKGASLRVLEPEFNTGPDTGRILVTVLGMVAEMELKFIRERQRAGIDNAKRNGVYEGRKPSVPVATAVVHSPRLNLASNSSGPTLLIS